MIALKSLTRHIFSLSIRARREIEVDRFGSSYGGWFVPRGMIDAHSIVYSGGVGEDASFEEGLLSATSCQVWAFDPTPRATVFASTISNPSFHFTPVGLWSSDSTQRFYAPADAAHVSHSIDNIQNTQSYFDAPCHSIATLMSEFQHDKLDLLKLDIEGAEYEVLKNLGHLRPAILCVEFHVISTIWETVRFVRALDYTPICVDGWNVTFLG